MDRIFAFLIAFVPSNLERSPWHAKLFFVATRNKLSAIRLISFIEWTSFEFHDAFVLC